MGHVHYQRPDHSGRRVAADQFATDSDWFSEALDFAVLHGQVRQQEMELQEWRTKLARLVATCRPKKYAKPLLENPVELDVTLQFTERFDTRDLKEAKLLLEELAV